MGNIEATLVFVYSLLATGRLNGILGVHCSGVDCNWLVPISKIPLVSQFIIVFFWYP